MVGLLRSRSSARKRRGRSTVCLSLELLENRTQPSVTAPTSDPPPEYEASEVAIFVTLEASVGARPIQATAGPSASRIFATWNPSLDAYLLNKPRVLSVVFDEDLHAPSILSGTNLKLEVSSDGHYYVEPTQWNEISFRFEYRADTKTLMLFPASSDVDPSAAFQTGFYRITLSNDQDPLRSARDGAPVGFDEHHPLGQTFVVRVWVEGTLEPDDDGTYEERHDVAAGPAPEPVAILILLDAPIMIPSNNIVAESHLPNPAPSSPRTMTIDPTTVRLILSGVAPAPSVAPSGGDYSYVPGFSLSAAPIGGVRSSTPTSEIRLVDRLDLGGASFAAGPRLSPGLFDWKRVASWLGRFLTATAVDAPPESAEVEPGP